MLSRVLLEQWYLYQLSEPPPDGTIAHSLKMIGGHHERYASTVLQIPFLNRPRYLVWRGPFMKDWSRPRPHLYAAGEMVLVMVCQSTSTGEVGFSQPASRACRF